MKKSSLFTIIIGALLVIGGITIFHGTTGHNTAGETQVLMHPSGELSMKFNPGWYFNKGFSSVETYRQNVTVAFGEQIDGASGSLDSIPVSFNDWAKGRIAGMVRVQLPSDSLHMALIRTNFAGGFEHFIEAGIAPVVQNAVNIAANLRASQEAATTLASFQSDISDQLMHGNFETRLVTKTVKDVDGHDQITKVTEVMLDSSGKPIRVLHQLMALGCTITQVKIDVPGFDESVQQAIARRRELSLETENAKQRSIMAEQDAMTSTKVGEANVAKKRAEFEVEKIAAVTTAEKDRDVARLKKEQAEYYKQQQILEGEGESTKRRLIMAADGGLKIKVEAWLASQKYAWDAYGKYSGNIVPVYTNGSSAGAGQNGFQTFMDVTAAKAAKDLSLDLSNRK